MGQNQSAPGGGTGQGDKQDGQVRACERSVNLLSLIRQWDGRLREMGLQNPSIPPNYTVMATYDRPILFAS
jgi:hypothetical protein